MIYLNNKFKNNKGFMMMELLVTSIAILVLFTSVYVNYYPTLGSYEERLSYNNIDSVYKNFYLRTCLLENNEITKLGEVSSDKCSDLIDKLGIEYAYISNYSLSEIKKNPPKQLKEYISYLPLYDKQKNNTNDKDYLRLFIKTKNGYSNMQIYTDDIFDDYGSYSLFMNSDTECTNSSRLVKFNGVFNNEQILLSSEDECINGVYCLKVKDFEDILFYKYSLNEIKEEQLEDCQNSSNIITISKNSYVFNETLEENNTSNQCINVYKTKCKKPNIASISNCGVLCDEK